MVIVDSLLNLHKPLIAGMSDDLMVCVLFLWFRPHMKGQGLEYLHCYYHESSNGLDCEVGYGFPSSLMFTQSQMMMIFILFVWHQYNLYYTNILINDNSLSYI